jgi:hypothetical protein
MYSTQIFSILSIGGGSGGSAAGGAGYPGAASGLARDDGSRRRSCNQHGDPAWTMTPFACRRSARRGPRALKPASSFSAEIEAEAAPPTGAAVVDAGIAAPLPASRSPRARSDPRRH